MTSRILALAAGLSLLGLGGCAATSVKGMRERTPILVADSARSVEAISECVSAAWIEGGVTPKLVPRTNGASLVHEETITYNMVFAVLDMDRVPAGTHAELRIFKTMWAKQNRNRVDEVRACL